MAGERPGATLEKGTPGEKNDEESAHEQPPKPPPRIHKDKRMQRKEGKPHPVIGMERRRDLRVNRTKYGAGEVRRGVREEAGPAEPYKRR